ncbi:MAG: hypothetical protein RLZZ591_760 [Pseudomonadota bacterium]|jgi:hypothetical protein
MGLFLDSFWRAVAYCVHPRVIALSFLPLVLMVTLSLGLGYFFWDAALDIVRTQIQASAIVSSVLGWLEGMGLGPLNAVVAPLIVIFSVTPLIVILSMFVVALFMTPSLVSLVAEKRFSNLERKQGGTFMFSLAWSLGSLAMALLVLVISLPLWLFPPLILVLPPLIWGWLTYRVMAFDALAAHASREERQQLFIRYRFWLLGIGVFSGYLGAAPSLIWASGAVFAAAFVILVPLAIWVYTLVFAFSSLWFAHFSLAALQGLRREHSVSASTAVPVPDAVALADATHLPSPGSISL